MRLSVVVPTWNEGARIAATLAPLQALRREGHEIIVVDGGSTDATVAAATPLADRVLQARRGRAAQMNAGAAAARGDALLFLHADTTIDAATIAAMLARLQDSGRVWGRHDVRIDGPSWLLPLVAVAMNVRSRVTGIATGDQAMFVRRSAFAAVGGFPDQPLMEDIALSRLLKRHAGRPLSLDRRVTTSGRRWQQHGVLRTILSMWRLRLAYWHGAPPATLAARYPAHHTAARTVVLQVFAKAPVSGAVKTRLAAAIGAAAATAVHAELVERTLAVASQARDGGAVTAIELWCAPDAAHPQLRAWAKRHRATLEVQCAGDLGARMHDALCHALVRGDTAILVGTDCPVLAPEQVHRAATALQQSDAVFAPAEDGGYALVGLARDLPLFSGIAWGGTQVMDDTRLRLRRAHATWEELDPVWDVDRPEDLARWRALARSAVP